MDDSDSDTGDILFNTVHSIRANYLRTVKAYLAESDVLAILESFERILTIRGLEASPADGAFALLDADEVRSIKAANKSPTAVRRWFEQQAGRLFVPFDVKFSFLRKRRATWEHVRTKAIRYEHQCPGGDDPDAEVIFLMLENIRDFVIVLPTKVWSGFMNQSGPSEGMWGLTSLIARIPPALSPFAVHLNDFERAVLHILALARSQDGEYDYVNPTTGVKLEGWRIATFPDPPLSPRNAGQQTAAMAVDYLREQIYGLDIPDFEFHYNPVAPLVADFFIRVPGLREYLSIEHKTGGRAARSESPFRAPRWPFLPGKQWNFVVWQPFAERSIWYCWSRHDFPDEWLDPAGMKNQIDLETDQISEAHRFQGSQGLRRLCQFVRDNAEASLIAAETAAYKYGPDVILSAKGRSAQTNSELALSTPSDAVDDGSANSPSGVKPKDKQTLLPDRQGAANEERRGEQTQHDIGDDVYMWRYQTTLYWLCGIINEICAQRRRDVLIPIDTGHPWGNCIRIRHDWTEKEQQRYQDTGLLPIYQFSPKAENPCVVIKLIECHKEHKLYRHHGDGLFMHFGNWLQHFEKQPFLFVGSTADPMVLAEKNIQSSFLFFPSEFTTIFNDEHQRRMDAPNSNGDGSTYLRSELQAEMQIFGRKAYDQLLKQFGVDTDMMFVKRLATWLTESGLDLPQEMIQTSQTEKEKREPAVANPQRFLLDCVLLNQHLEAVLDGSANENMRVTCIQSNRPNPGFRKQPYRVTLREVNQASWRWGLRRRQIAKTELSEDKQVCPFCINPKRYKFWQPLKTHVKREHPDKELMRPPTKEDDA